MNLFLNFNRGLEEMLVFLVQKDPQVLKVYKEILEFLDSLGLK
jgi:hypothetical protein